jgi:hypothetical protein
MQRTPSNIPAPMQKLRARLAEEPASPKRRCRSSAN